MLHTIKSWITASLNQNYRDIAALTALSCSLTIPLTQIKGVYGDTLGYGLSTFLQTLVLRHTFPPVPHSFADWLTWATLFHGFRLAFYLYIRERSGYTVNDPTDSFPRAVRVPYAMTLSFLYALFVSPVLHAVRSPPLLRPAEMDGTALLRMIPIAVAWLGTLMAWSGVLLETVSDWQKFRIKLNQRRSKRDHVRHVFEGPLNGPYRFCRHPNYAGELMFWFGVWLAGLPSCCQSKLACLCSTVGLLGISAVVLLIATPNCERNQLNKYKGQELYEQWIMEVPSIICPNFRPKLSYLFESQVTIETEDLINKNTRTIYKPIPTPVTPHQAIAVH